MSNIFEKKMAFNFYRSYYETSLLLQKDDKAEFLEAILHYQFTGELIEPKSPMALLAFRGQMHSLNKQVTGYKSGKNTYPNGNPTKGEHKGEHKGSHKEEQEKEKEKGKGKEKEEINNINFDKLLLFLNSKTGRNFKIINEPTKKKYNARLKEGYTKDDILKAITNAVNSDYHKENGFKFLTPEFFSRADKLNLYSSINNKPKENNVKSLIPKGVSYSGPQY